MTLKRLYGTIQKADPQEDGTIIVTGIASTESVDSQGEIVTADAMKAAIPDYMRFGAVREMHDAKKAAGTALNIGVNDAGSTDFTAHVVDPIAIKKVQSGVYKGFSIAGKVLKRDESDENKITALSLTEVSLVDRPANPDAVFTCYKADGAEVEEDEEGEEDKKPKPGEKKPNADEGGDGNGEEEKAKDKQSSKKEGDSEESEKSAKPSITKSAYQIESLARLADSLAWFASDIDCCAAYDDAPAGLAEAARGVASTLYDMLLQLVAHDVEAAKARLSEAGDQAAMKADNPAAEVRAALSDAIAKAQAIVSPERDGLADIVKAAGFEPDAPRAEVIANLVTDRDRLTKRVKELEAEPAPIKGVLRAVEKADDVSDTGLSKASADEKDPLALIQKAHMSGGQRLYP